MVVLTLFSPQTVLLCLSCLLGTICGRWHPLRLCSLIKHQHKVESPRAGQDGEPQLEAVCWDCSGAQCLIALLTSSLHRAGLRQTWTSHVVVGTTSLCCLQRFTSVFSLCWRGTLQEELFIDFIFGPKTSAVKSRPAQNHRGRICCLRLTIHWQRGELALGVLYISFPPLETSKVREKKANQTHILSLFCHHVQERGNNTNCQ